MSEEIYLDQESKINVCHINARTRPLFKSMLNTLGNSITVGKTKLKYGDAIKHLEPNEFDSLFNRWVTLCIERKIMRRTLSTDCTRKLEWSQELSDVERAFHSMEVLKEIM